MLHKTLYPLALALVLQACGNQTQNPNPDQANTAQASSPSSNPSETSPAPEQESSKLAYYLGMQNNTWYKGEIGGTPIWLYTGFSGGYGDYGYESSNGADIDIRIKTQGSNLTIEHSSYPNGKEYKETFTGKEDPTTGRIEGKWSNNKGKSSSFSLQPLTVKAQNAKELLDDLHLIKTPSNIDARVLSYKNIYKDKKAHRLVHNLSSIIPKTDMGGQDLDYRDQKSIFLGKVALPNQRWLVFYTANSAEELGDYSTDNVYCAAIFDQEGKLLNTLMLGNNGSDPYYQEMLIEVPSPTKIVCTTIHFYRGEGGARMEEESATTKRTITIKGDRFAE